MTNTAIATDLMERLASHQTLKGLPQHELEWLVAHGELRRFDGGEVIVRKGDAVGDMFVMLTGRIGVYVDRGTGRRHTLQSVAGEVSGNLPYSRITTAIGEVFSEEPSDVFAVSRDHFPAMIQHCPELTATLVHVMIDRSRTFASTDWQDEKMVALGRFAAGIAHELNNPASAATRSAQLLERAMREAEDAAHMLGHANLSETQRARVISVRDHSLNRTTGVFSAMETSDREDELSDWLDEHGVDGALAAALTDSGVTTRELDDLADCLDHDALPVGIRWIAAGYTVRSLAIDIERASRRIYDLVSAMKRFTYMDRATVSEPTDVAQGLIDTIAVLAHKAKSKSAAVRLELPPALPRVEARTGELNQVWSNLIENALDAVAPSGEVRVRADTSGSNVQVRVIDNGPGIPADVQSRIFDPFFTTKPLGEGTGLGLDIARRIVRGHYGQIAVDSRPGRTEFTVTLPLSHPATPPPA